MVAIENIQKQESFGIYLPKGLYELMEETRKKLGLNRSKFIQTCIIFYLQQLSVISTTVKQPKTEEPRSE